MDPSGARSEVLALMQKLEEEPDHVQQVARLALQLFDQLRDWHGLDEHNGLLLESAALLHDIGSSVAPGGKGHHKESARLIREHSWTGFEPLEVSLIALIARYHRKSPPKPKHARFAALSPADQRRVRILAGFLRMADGLDRAHLQSVQRLKASLSADCLLIQLEAPVPLPREVEGARKKSDLLSLMLKREIRVEQANAGQGNEGAGE